MNKPKNWYDLPYRIQEWFLENFVSFEYDSYEGSREEELYAALNHGNNYRNSTNNKRIQDTYEKFPASDLEIELKRLVAGLEGERKMYQELLNNEN